MQAATSHLQTTATVPALLTQGEMCALVKKSPKWAEAARLHGDGPRFVKLGRSVRYRAADVLEWINENIRTSTADTGAGE
jgi:predicted DNA-binding transcriptional regulator AlpA